MRSGADANARKPDPLVAYRFSAPGGMVTVVWPSSTETRVMVCRITSTAVGFGFWRAITPPRSLKPTPAEVQVCMGSSGWYGEFAGARSGELEVAEKYSTCAPSALR